MMRIGLFADSHDHLTNIRLAVDRFNRERVDLVLFAGDLVSTIAVPPLRKLQAPLIACFGDNEGNKTGLLSGFRLRTPAHVPGVDDIASRKGLAYRTTLFDFEGGRAIVMMPQRCKESFRGWLDNHLDAEVLGHDRGERLSKANCRP